MVCMLDKYQPQMKANLKIATTDLVLVTLLASLGMATKNIIAPLVSAITGSLYIPGGSVAGGLYMMWPILAFGLVRKVGAASLCAIIQAFLSLILPYGNFGILSFPIYLLPGLAADAFFLLSTHRACCVACCMGAGAIANTVGTVLVGSIVLALPQITLLFLVVLAAISGFVGGYIANMLLVRIRKIGFGGRFNYEKHSKTTKEAI